MISKPTDNFEAIVLASILKYRKPVKTKHLARKLNMNRIELVSILNILNKQNLICFQKVTMKNDDIVYGWIKK